MRKLRLDRETLSDLSSDELAALAGGGPATVTCFVSDGDGGCRLTFNGCPWTGDPCLLTGTPPSYRVCA